MSVIWVFVYGTLKPGHDNHNRYCRNRLLQMQPAQVRGSLYDLCAGYPAMAHSQQWVQGYRLCLNADRGKTLSELDDLEDYVDNNPNSLYQREKVEVFNSVEASLGFAWAYFMEIERIHAMQGILVPQGIWDPHDREY